MVRIDKKENLNISQDKILYNKKVIGIIKSWETDASSSIDK